MLGNLPPKDIFYQVDKMTYFISHSEDIFRVGLIMKDSVIICETIKWLSGTGLFRGDFYPLKPFWARKKNTCRLVFRVLQHMCERTKSEGDTYLGFLVRKDVVTFKSPWKLTSRSKLMAQSNVPLGPGQPLSKQFFRR